MLDEVEHHPYLGVEIANDLNWKHHVNQVTTKSTGILAFLRRNLGKSNKKVKEKAYMTLVRPNLEYAASAWDPFRKCQIDALERVQRRAARFVTGKYSRDQSVTTMLRELQWPSLHQRRRDQRLVNFYKGVNSHNALKLPPYLTMNKIHTRRQHGHNYTQMCCNTDSYKYSFFPRTIVDWNSLPHKVVNQETVDSFKNMLSTNPI